MILDFRNFSKEIYGCPFDMEHLRSMLLNALHGKYPKRSLCPIGFSDGILEFQMGYVGRHVFAFKIYYKGMCISEAEVSDPTLFFEDSRSILSEKCDKYVECICHNLCDRYGVCLITK